jgi:hypothetical protein
MVTPSTELNEYGFANNLSAFTYEKSIADITALDRGRK